MLGRATTMMPKEAIGVVKASVVDLFGDEGIEDVRLEEIRYEGGPDRWLVTVGFESVRPKSLTLIDRLQPSWRREYKVVAIDDATGEAISVTNRQID